MPLFDAYVMVDWSGSNVPKLGKDSIWVGVCTRAGDKLNLGIPYNTRTRQNAQEVLLQMLQGFIADKLRVLIGFDFPYGYPKGFAQALQLNGPAWSATWNRVAADVIDNNQNQNNRFAAASGFNTAIGNPPGPFWGCPLGNATAALFSTKGQGFPFAVPIPPRIHCPNSVTSIAFSV